ncbi:MAG: sensor histidine kinase, partial [Clostridia bacterium]|nr:sensor histidine kinase [Clostridia bacterium]
TARGKKVLVSVYNSGAGIPSEDLPFVFERLYKSDRSRGLDKTGTGLGLFIAKTIITQHAEEITVKSEEGAFCEFAFTLPLVLPAGRGDGLRTDKKEN